ncbi:outer membrane protein transport protein [Vibrio sagamiensis]|uniref:Long-chain fatty acid outer membrane transporter n=1 Tax=Vibrio sagamiensis NBRC 104589 TaxID=1219064 RepID=A0A511QGK2_9VIBR|nr:outer membrane protein transport protein [Vibrio sagamiensis]PNQ68043.1 long-chain fatty acid transporter [Vibrio agarivorans]GEM76434.1 long-chain fatty acid outer membrane transporter [Vibrio sagamiensis NBRC 104589]
MNKKRCSLLSVSILMAFNAHSAGFQVNEHSASGLGRAFSGEGAVADNASVLARNPAAMTRFKEAQLSGAFSIVDPEIDVYDVTNNEHSKDVAPMQFVPAAYYISPINDQWAWGFGMFTNYGVATDYPDDISAGDLAGDTSLVSVNFNPNVAYRINEQFSIGGGVNLVYAQAELTRHQGNLTSASGDAQKSKKLISMDGDTVAFGWNVGALFELNENHRFGFGYRSKIDLDFDDGEFNSYDSGLSNPQKVKGRLKISLPAIIELSGFHQLNDQWAVHYGWQHTDWSEFTELKATSSDCVGGVCFQKPEHYKGNNRYSVGGAYTLNQDWTLRAGIAYDEQAGEATLSIPDSDRMWYTAGFTYKVQENLSLDAGFALVKSKSGSFKETNNINKEISFDSKGVAYISAIQMNYTFK